MKSVLGVIIIILIFIILAGCSDEENRTDKANQTEGDSNAGYSEIYTDLSEQFTENRYIGVSRSEIPLPTETVYMESAEAIGFDNIIIYGVRGSMTMMFKDGKSISCTFGSKAFKEKSDFSVKINNLNEKIAEALGTSVHEFKIVCNDKTLDEREAVFSGKGVLETEYDAGVCKLVIKAIGSDKEAIVTVTQILK